MSIWIAWSILIIRQHCPVVSSRIKRINISNHRRVCWRQDANRPARRSFMRHRATTRVWTPTRPPLYLITRWIWKYPRRPHVPRASVLSWDASCSRPASATNKRPTMTSTTATTKSTPNSRRSCIVNVQTPSSRSQNATHLPTLACPTLNTC